MLFVKKIGQWELSSEAKRSTRALPKTSQIFWTESESPFLWGDVVPLQHVCSSVHFAWHMRRLQWVQICLSPHKKVVRQRAEALRDKAVLGIYDDTTDLQSECTSTWCPLMSGRKNWQAWHTASIFRQLMCRPDSSSDQRPKVGLSSHSAPQPFLEALSWQPSFCVPCLRSRLALARGGPSNGPWATSRRVGMSSECRSGSAQHGRMVRPRLPSNSLG